MSSLTLDKDAAIAVGIAATALPFAQSPEAEAERWLRILRTHGEASLVLSSAGLTEARQPEGPSGCRRSADSHLSDPDILARITHAARQRAQSRGAAAIETSDLLMAVAQVYGDDFDCVLLAHGTSREQVLDLLTVQSRG